MRPTERAGEPAPLSELNLEELWSGACRIMHALRHISSNLSTPLAVADEFRLHPGEGHVAPFANQQSEFASIMALHVDGLELANLAMRDGKLMTDRAQVKLYVGIDRGTTGVAEEASHTTTIREHDMKFILDRCRNGSNSVDMTGAEGDLDATARFVRLNLERMNAANGYDKKSVLSFTA